MRKFLMIIGILFIMLAVLSEIVIPKTLTGMLKTKILELTASQDVDLSLDSSPRFLMALGQVDEVHCTVKNGRIGELDAAELSLDGEKISVDMPTLLFGDRKNDGENKKLRTEEVLKSVGKVELRGVISEENLQKFLEEKIGKLENIKVKMTPEDITATANIKIMGRTADVELSGIIIADEGDLYFRMTKLNVRNALLRHVQLDRFFGDIKIADGSKLPIGLKFDNVELQNGQAVLTAVR